MYTIIGGDGKEYGPVTAAQVIAWIAGGRANLDTQAKLLGTNEWKRLGDYPELLGETPPPLIDSPQPEAGHADLADRSERIGAWLLDSLFAMICALPVLCSIPFAVLATAINGRDWQGMAALPGVGLGLGLTGAALLVLCVIQIVMLSTRGQTIGKRIVGIRIVRLDGSNPGFVRAWLVRDFARGMICAIPHVGQLFWVLDFAWIFRGDRRCLHDLMAGTRVVSAKRTAI